MQVAEPSPTHVFVHFWRQLRRELSDTLVCPGAISDLPGQELMEAMRGLFPPVQRWHLRLERVRLPDPSQAMPLTGGTARSPRLPLYSRSGGCMWWQSSRGCRELHDLRVYEGEDDIEARYDGQPHGGPGRGARRAPLPARVACL